MSFIEQARRALGGEDLAGWLFFNFHGRDTIANRLLGLDENAFNTRPWFCLLPTGGEPLKIVHAIEKGILDKVPGTTKVYSSRQELSEILKPLAGKWAAQVSENITVISTLDHGTAVYLENIGFSLVSSADLIQKTLGVLDEEGIASHQRAASLLYECIHLTWDRIRSLAAPEEELTESGVQGWILDFFQEKGLITNHPILVAAGIHSSDPHYTVPPSGGAICRGDLIQFDIWAKENRKEAIYADISWVGILSSAVTPEQSALFRIVTGARDRALQFISERIESSSPVTGAEVDAVTRAFIDEAGYGRFFCHRTGHGIDTEVHGSGANMDSIEFPDTREIIEGSCFSIEPGIYLDRFGMRTEIDAYRWKNRLIISGGPIQTEILTL